MANVTKTQTSKGYRYEYNGKVIRNSKRDYKYALLGTPKKALGATGDGETFVIGLGNNTKSLVSSWSGIMPSAERQVVEIVNA